MVFSHFIFHLEPYFSDFRADFSQFRETGFNLEDQYSSLRSRRNSRYQHLIYSVAVHIHNLIPQSLQYNMVSSYRDSLQNENDQPGDGPVVSQSLPWKRARRDEIFKLFNGRIPIDQPGAIFPNSNVRLQRFAERMDFAYNSLKYVVQGYYTLNAPIFVSDKGGMHP